MRMNPTELQHDTRTTQDVNLRRVDFSRMATDICRILNMSNWNFDCENAISQLGGKCVSISRNECLKRGYNPDGFRTDLVVSDDIIAGSSFVIYKADWRDASELYLSTVQEVAKLILFHITPNGGLSATTKRGYSISDVDVLSMRFAAELTMPREKFIEIAQDVAIEGIVDIREIAEQLGVSFSAAKVRGHVLGLW